MVQPPKSHSASCLLTGHHMTPNHRSNSLYLQSQRNAPTIPHIQKNPLYFSQQVKLAKRFYLFSYVSTTNITFLPTTNNLPHQQLSNFLYLAFLKMPKTVTIHYTNNPHICNDNPFLMYKSWKIPCSFFSLFEQ